MRTEQEMMGIILGIAKEDERIRAVYMNGSRTDPNAPKDIYQDYDLVFVVTKTQAFIDDKQWILRFGTPLMLQEPDWNDTYAGYSGEPHDSSRSYAWLMLFDDGNRIDLGIETYEETEKNFTKDKLTVLLLDKDGRLPSISPPTDTDYHVRRPSQNEYWARCNNFWWCLGNVAKGIARDELPYAMWMYNVVVRDELVKMLEWKIGVDTGFSVSAGKLGKYFKKYLASTLYADYAKTYSGSDYNDFWAAIFTACDLFHVVAMDIAQKLSFDYRQSEEDGMREYLLKVRSGAYGG